MAYRYNSLKTLEISVEFKDKKGVVIALNNLSRIWQTTKGSRIRSTIAQILGIRQEEAENMLKGD